MTTDDEEGGYEGYAWKRGGNPRHSGCSKADCTMCNPLDGREPGLICIDCVNFIKRL